MKHYTATFRSNPPPPPPQEPGTQFFDLTDESVSELGGTRPDRLVDVRPQQRVQRRTLEQLVGAAPCLPALDAPVPLLVEQLVDVLSLVAKYEKEMDRLEDRILQGAPVSAAEKAALETLGFEGRRVFVEEKEKEEEKEASSRVFTVQNCAEDRETPQEQGFGRRSWCRAVSSSTEYGLPVVRRDVCPQCKLRSRPLRFFRCSSWTRLCPCLLLRSRQCSPWRSHSCSSWTRLTCPLWRSQGFWSGCAENCGGATVAVLRPGMHARRCATTGSRFRHCRKLWRCHRCSSHGLVDVSVIMQRQVSGFSLAGGRCPCCAGRHLESLR